MVQREFGGCSPLTGILLQPSKPPNLHSPPSSILHPSSSNTILHWCHVYRPNSSCTCLRTGSFMASRPPPWLHEPAMADRGFTPPMPASSSSSSSYSSPTYHQHRRHSARADSFQRSFMRLLAPMERFAYGTVDDEDSYTETEVGQRNQNG